MKLPKVITISGMKGGTGKSTVSINLAVEFSKRYPVRVLDLDRQKSTWIFNKVRAAHGLDVIDVIEMDDLKDFKKAVKGFDGVLIVDVGGHDSDLTRAALKDADLIVCPVSPSEIEIYALLIFNKVLKTLKGRKAHVLINRASARASNVSELISQVRGHAETLSLLSSRLGDRSDFQKCFITGQGVTEMKAGTAAGELKKLSKELEKCLK